MTSAEEVRQKCGTVYTWNCAGELYGIECELCSERPIYALDEFAEHMELWHSDWQQSPEDELMQEVLAEQSSGGEVNDLKQQLVQELNSIDTLPLPQPQPQIAKTICLSDHLKFGNNNAISAAENQKLTTQHIQQLIQLYKAEPRLWNQTHSEFRNMELGRKSWHNITDAWNAYCGRSFTVTDVRIRISTLCQRFLKQRERLEAEGELDDNAKFVHYEQLTFLCEQQALLKRQEHFEWENRKLLEIYEHYPILWHNAHKKVRCVNTIRKRDEAQRGLQLALRIRGIMLSGLAIKRRIQSLRKRYRLEKIRYLHSIVEGKQSEFVSGFEHYAEMEFLHKHIDPYVCAVCGKIFESLVGHKMHVQSSCEAGVIVNFLTAEATVGELMVQMEPGIFIEAEESTEMEESQIVTDREHMVENRKPAEEKLTSVQAQKQIQELLSEEMKQEKKNLDQQQNQEQLQVPEKEKLLAEEYENLKKENQEQELLLEKPELEIKTLPLAEESATVEFGKPAAFEGTSSDETSPIVKKQRLRLSLQQTQKLIELYQAQPNLWDPNHLDYHQRKLRRLAWDQIAAELNSYSSCKQRYSWQMLHRKLTDYIKYYRKERQRQDSGEGSGWTFYEAFSFLDDIVPISCELQKTLQQRDTNLKIIQVYQSYEQLWCTNHPDYTKRNQRQRQLESLCTRLQEECNLQITVERLKNRLIEFRCQYRLCKVARQAALKLGHSWQPSYEYYDSLKFLELHVSPFNCCHCPNSFKRRTDLVRHQRNVHADQEQIDLGPSRKRRTRHGINNENDFNPLEHICHICAMKFSLRTSLLAHLRRHLGQRSHACTECPKKFFNSTALRVHLRSHTKELPYVCEHCARGFINASKLNQHIKRHGEQRDYPCSRCDKAFYSAHERDRHTRAHLNIRDKVCPFCSRAFVVGSAYYAHLNLHRGEKRYACTSCGQRFAQYAGLYKHRKRCTVLEITEK